MCSPPVLINSYFSRESLVWVQGFKFVLKEFLVLVQGFKFFDRTSVPVLDPVLHISSP